jgi:hypothetical protein
MLMVEMLMKMPFAKINRLIIHEIWATLPSYDKHSANNLTRSSLSLFHFTNHCFLKGKGVRGGAVNGRVGGAIITTTS